MSREVFSEDQGELSTMRMLAFILVLYGCAATTYVLGVWGYLCLTNREFYPLRLSDVAAVLAGPGALVAKAVQKKYETPQHRAEDAAAEPPPGEEP